VARPPAVLRLAEGLVPRRPLLRLNCTRAFAVCVFTAYWTRQLTPATAPGAFCCDSPV
jgi:hypothetical protein